MKLVQKLDFNMTHQTITLARSHFSTHSDFVALSKVPSVLGSSVTRRSKTYLSAWSHAFIVKNSTLQRKR